MPALTFIAANWLPCALVAVILAIVFRDKLIDLIAPLGWQDDDGFHRGEPHGPVHSDPGRDSRRGARPHNGFNATRTGVK